MMWVIDITNEIDVLIIRIHGSLSSQLPEV